MSNTNKRLMACCAWQKVFIPAARVFATHSSGYSRAHNRIHIRTHRHSWFRSVFVSHTLSAQTRTHCSQCALACANAVQVAASTPLAARAGERASRQAARQAGKRASGPPNRSQHRNERVCGANTRAESARRRAVSSIGGRLTLALTHTQRVISLPFALCGVLKTPERSV